MKARVISLISVVAIVCLLPALVWARGTIPYRVTFLAVGMTFPNKPITVRCTVMSQGHLLNEKVTISEAYNKSIVLKESMKLVQLEGDKRIYEYTIDPLAVGDYQFNCHVYFDSDEYEMVAKKFSHLNVTEIKESPGKSTVNLATPLYVKVTEDQVITSGMAFDILEKETLIRSIGEKGVSSLRREELLKKSVDELKAIHGDPLPKEEQVRDILPGKGAISQNVDPECPEDIPHITLWSAGKLKPNKPAQLRCTVRSEAILPGEKVAITKEVDDNRVVLKEIMTLVEVKQGERVYDYITEPLYVGDYKFNCKLNYVSDKYAKDVSFNDKDKVAAKDNQNGLYNIEITKSYYVMVRDDEVIAYGGDFELIEQTQLAWKIMKNKKSSLSFEQLLKKSIEELEIIYGDKLLKYKAYGKSRPK